MLGAAARPSPRYSSCHRIIMVSLIQLVSSVCNAFALIRQCTVRGNIPSASFPDPCFVVRVVYCQICPLKQQSVM